jgi:hypothetical protein
MGSTSNETCVLTLRPKLRATRLRLQGACFSAVRLSFSLHAVAVTTASSHDGLALPTADQPACVLSAVALDVELMYAAGELDQVDVGHAPRLSSSASCTSATCIAHAVSRLYAFAASRRAQNSSTILRAAPTF